MTHHTPLCCGLELPIHDAHLDFKVGQGQFRGCEEFIWRKPIMRPLEPPRPRTLQEQYTDAVINGGRKDLPCFESQIELEEHIDIMVRRRYCGKCEITHAKEWAIAIWAVPGPYTRAKAARLITSWQIRVTPNFSAHSALKESIKNEFRARFNV